MMKLLRISTIYNHLDWSSVTCSVKQRKITNTSSDLMPWRWSHPAYSSSNGTPNFP